jgi:hypothetical protein
MISNDGSPDLIITSADPRARIFIELKDLKTRVWDVKVAPGDIIVTKIEESEHEAANIRDALRAPLQRAAMLVDLVPVPGLRKTLRKLLADEQHEIAELYANGRAKTAWWRTQCAWGYAVIYTLKYPLTLLVLALIKKFSVGG